MGESKTKEEKIKIAKKLFQMGLNKRSNRHFK